MGRSRSSQASRSEPSGRRTRSTRAFSETGLRGVFFVALCAAMPLGVGVLARGVTVPSRPPGIVTRTLDRLEDPAVAWWLAIVGAAGTVLVIAWEWALVRSPPGVSARLAIYWVDDRWQWPLLLVAGIVGISGLATLARRGSIVPAVWCAGCLALGVLGAVGLPLPVWYRFLLLCQIPLALGVAVVVSRSWRSRTTALILATFCLALGVKVVTLLDSSAKVSYFGSPLQPAWALGDHIPPGPGIVATDPKTAYFIPAATGHRVLTLDKGHASSRTELVQAETGYQLLRRHYAGGRDWWNAAQQMWRRGVRYVVVEKHTTLEPRSLAAFTWETSMLRTQADRRALSRYFYANNRVGNLIFDSADYAVYRLDPQKAPRVRGVPRADETRAVSGTIVNPRPAIAGVVSELVVSGVRNPGSYGVARYAARLAEALAFENVLYRVDDRPTTAQWVHFHLANSSRALLARGSGRAFACVVTVHDVVPRTRALVPLYRALAYPRLARCAAVVVHSRFAADMLLRECARRPARLEVIHFPAQPPRVTNREQARRSLAWPEDALIAVLPGVLKTAKLVREALASVSRAPGLAACARRACPRSRARERGTRAGSAGARQPERHRL